MRVDFKYKPGDTVFMLTNNKVYEVEIEKCFCSIEDIDGDIVKEFQYELKKHPINPTYIKIYFEKVLFATKQELLNTL